VNRRDALRGISALLGTAITPGVAQAVLRGYSAPAPGQQLRTLTAEQGALLDTLTEMIIPATNTPGARAARVFAFVDGLLADIVTAEERDGFVAGLTAVDERAQSRHGARFLDCSQTQQVDMLATMERESREAGDGERPFFAWLKELTLVGYYTSEIGASQELTYVHVAGHYDGNVPYEDVGRAYS
jgi:hypothetical protein